MAVPPPADPPWSPYPVQDWSSLPEDPLQWPPPTGRPVRVGARRWWPPLLVFVLIGALIATLGYLGSATAPGTTVAAAGYLPADGTATYERVDTTRETTTTSTTQVTESARLSGVTAVLSTETTFGTQAFAPHYDEVETLRVWRTITTPLGRPGTRQTTRVHRTNDDITLLGESGPDGARIYRPGLVELPRDVAPGRSWRSSGSAGNAQTYVAELRAAAVDPDCLRVTGQVAYTGLDGRLERTVGLERTWCRGRGMVETVSTLAPITVHTSPIAAPTPSGVVTADRPIRWSAPQQWARRELTVVSLDPALGKESMNGTTLALTPVPTASGPVVQAMSGSNDLIGLEPLSTTEWRPVWRAHVPGTVLTLAAFGDVVVVTTSARQVFGYSAAGVRLWASSLGELAPAAPVRLSEDAAVLTDLGGRVRVFSLLTGEVRWTVDVGADVRLSAATGDGLVVVMDQGGTVTALDAGRGTTRWTRELEGRGAVALDGTVVVLQDQTAHGLDPRDGTTRWRRPFFGTLTTFVAFDDRAVIGTRNATLTLDRDGGVRGRYGGAISATATRDHLILWGPERAQLLDRSGAELATWELPPLTLALQIRPAVTQSAGVLLFGLTWSFEGWSGQEGFR